MVETTLDLPIQAAAEQAVRAGVAAAQARACSRPPWWRSTARAGSAPMSAASTTPQSQFDRATQAQRQAGSSFKPFVYLTAMEAGRTPDTPVVDEPITIGNWSPRNYTGQYLGPITLETALAQSINTVAARLANEVGTANVAATAHRLGITSPIQTRPVHGAGRRRGEPAGDGPGL